MAGTYGRGSWQTDTGPDGRKRHFCILPASASANGKRKKSPRFHKPADLRAWESVYLDEQQRLKLEGRASLDGPLSFEEAMRHWLASTRADPPKRQGYERIVDLHLVPFFGGRLISEITPDDVHAYMDGKIAGTAPVGEGKNGRRVKTKLTKTTLGEHIRILRAMYEHEEQADRYRGKNPAGRNRSSKLASIKRSSPKAKTLGRVELADLMAAAPPRHRQHIGILILCGLRSGEAAALTWGDWNRSRLRIEKARKAGTERKTIGGVERTWPIVGPPKTDTSHRTLVCSEQVDRLLREQRRYLRSQGLPVGRDALIFPNAVGTVLAGTSFRRSLAEIARKAGIQKHVTPHMLRHSFTEQALNQGANIAEVALLLGHSDASTTLREYVHLMGSDAPEVPTLELDPEEARRNARESNRRRQPKSAR
jgi:integrase